MTTLMISGVTQAASNPNYKKVTVKYRCLAANKSIPVTVQYGVVGSDIVDAKVISKVITTKVLKRDLNAINSDMQNVYSGNGLTWTTDSATAENLTSAIPNILAKKDGSIILKNCDLSKAK